MTICKVPARVWISLSPTRRGRSGRAGFVVVPSCTSVKGSLSDALSDAEAALASSQDPDLLRARALGVQLSDGGLIRQTTMALHAQGRRFGFGCRRSPVVAAFCTAIGPPESRAAAFTAGNA